MLWAVLPLKDLVLAKSRLSGLLAPQERRALAQAMVEDVLTVLTAHPAVAGTVLVSDDPTAELLARSYGIERLSEQELPGTGLNAAVAGASRCLRDRDVAQVMVLHGDIPLLAESDLDALVSAFLEPEIDIVLGPDLAGSGTNVLMYPMQHEPLFAYGEGSLQAHRNWAQKNKLCVQEVKRRGCGLDVDSPGDLIELFHVLKSTHSRTHTAVMLGEGDIAGRLMLMEGSGLGDKFASEAENTAL